MHGLHVESASIEALEAEAARHGITLIVLLATYFPHKGTGVHNYDLLNRIGGRPLFKMFGSLAVPNNLEAGLAELRTLAHQNAIAGIKLYTGYQGFEASEARLYPIYDLAEEYKLPIMYHGGELHHCDSQFEELARPQYVEQPARDYPRVKFVVSHLANPYFAELRGVMSRCPNVWTDISGQFVSGTAEDTEEYRRLIVAEIRQFLAGPNGYGRVMFGTDFPIQSYDSSLDLVKRLKLANRDEQNILEWNALRFLNPHSAV